MTVPLRSGDPITVNVALGARAYDIAIGRGLLATLGERQAAVECAGQVVAQCGQVGEGAEPRSSDEGIDRHPLLRGHARGLDVERMQGQHAGGDREQPGRVRRRHEQQLVDALHGELAGRGHPPTGRVKWSVNPRPALAGDRGPRSFDQIVDEPALPATPCAWAGGGGVGAAQRGQLAEDVGRFAE
jgi:hypothetical protein